MGRGVRGFQKAVNCGVKTSVPPGAMDAFLDILPIVSWGLCILTSQNMKRLKELETSLTTADSARTKFYLNRCNEAILKISKCDPSPGD